jgi:hypothetical protein
MKYALLTLLAALVLATTPAFAQSANTQLRQTDTGLLIGSSATQKLAFYGGARVVQPHSAAQAALVNNTGGSTANATLAAGALTDNSGGATADGTIAAVAAPSALTDNTTGTASTTLASISDAATKNAIASLAARQAENRAAIVALTDAVKELSTASNAHNDNLAKIAVLVNAVRSALAPTTGVGLLKGAN